MNGKILILLIKLNKSSLELPFVLVFYFHLTLLSEKQTGVFIETHGLHWMQQPLETSLKKRRLAIKGKELSYVRERTSFF